MKLRILLQGVIDEIGPTMVLGFRPRHHMLTVCQFGLITCIGNKTRRGHSAFARNDTQPIKHVVTTEMWRERRLDVYDL